MFKTKIKLTYESIPEVFKQMEKELKPSISNFFLKASTYMDSTNANEAWVRSVEEEKANTNFTPNDIGVIKGLSKMLGSMDIEGQVNNIELVIELLNRQIEEAEKDRDKNEKMCRTLSTCVGLAIAVVLI